MRKYLTPWNLVLLGLFFVTLGMVLSWLMVLQIIKSMMFLNFFSYTSSVAGMIIGFIGMTMVARVRRK